MMQIPFFRKCAQCGESKLFTEFSRMKKTKDGYHPWCKQCAKAYWAEYYAKNADEIKEYQRENPDPEKHKRYRERHRDELRARAREQNALNPEINREKMRRRWIGEKGDHYRAWNRKWAKTEKGRLNNLLAKNRQRAAGDLNAAEWIEICNQYGNKCLKCGRTDRPLSPDHILPVSKGGKTTKDNIQPLCLPCNKSKGNKTIDYRNR